MVCCISGESTRHNFIIVCWMLTCVFLSFAYLTRLVHFVMCIWFFVSCLDVHSVCLSRLTWHRSVHKCTSPVSYYTVMFCLHVYVHVRVQCALDSSVDFGAIYVVCLCIFCFLTYPFSLLIYSPYLPFPLRIDPLYFQAGVHKRRPNLGFFSCYGRPM